MRINGDTIQAVYDDRQLDLFKLLGDVTVTRFSHVEFDNAAGVWMARRPSGEIICKAVTRDDCLAIEKHIAEEEVHNATGLL